MTLTLDTSGARPTGELAPGASPVLFPQGAELATSYSAFTQPLDSAEITSVVGDWVTVTPRVGQLTMPGPTDARPRPVTPLA